MTKAFGLRYQVFNCRDERVIKEKFFPTEGAAAHWLEENLDSIEVLGFSEARLFSSTVAGGVRPC